MAADKDKEMLNESQKALIAAIRAKFEEDRQILISTLEQRLQDFKKSCEQQLAEKDKEKARLKREVNPSKKENKGNHTTTPSTEELQNRLKRLEQQIEKIQKETK